MTIRWQTMGRRIAWLVLAGIFTWRGSARAADTGTNITFNNGRWSLSGQVGVGNGGTGADLSGTGGTSQYVKQATSGAAFTVGTIPAVDLPTHTHQDSSNGGTLSTAALTAGTLPIARGGTNSTTALNNGKCMHSSAGAIVEASADCATGGTALVGMSTLGDLTAGNTVYVAPDTVDQAEARGQQRVANAATFTNVACASSASPGASKSFTVTFRRGTCGSFGSQPGSPPTCTITGSSSTTCSDTSNTLSVSAGQCWDASVVSDSGAATAVVSCTAERTS